MKPKKIVFLLLILLFTPKVFSQVGYKEKMAILQKNFNTTSVGGPTWDEFGDLVFEKNGKTYWLSTFCSIVDVADDYYRVFEIDFLNGNLKEVTKEMLGGYFPTGGFNPPYYYEDIDNDGIKDILIFDHGKELQSEQGHWGGTNVFFKGNINGFVKTEIPKITTEKKYYHAHAVNDFDRDGDLDIAFGTESANIFVNDGKGNFTQQMISNLGLWGYFINNNYYASGSFGLKFVNIDNDKELELLSPIESQAIYLDYSNNTWTAKFFGAPKQFIWKDNIHIGVEQVLEFANNKSKKNDLMYRIATFDVPTEGGVDMKWMSKLYLSRSNKLDSVYLFKNSFTQSNSFFFLDPKQVDLNFDGTPDIFFKEDEFWGNTGQKLHAVNQRMWLNDGETNFANSTYKFSDDANQLIYILAKVDSVKKINIMFSQRAVPYDQTTNKFTQDIRYLYNRIDTIVYPIAKIQSLSLCNGTTSKLTVSNVPINITLTNNSNAGITANTGRDFIQIKGTEIGSGKLNYKFKNDFFESDEHTINYEIKGNPTTPTISRDGSLLISSSSISNQWYLDGVKLTGETSNKIKAVSTGIYTVQTTGLNGCLSNMSKGEYGMILGTSEENSINAYPNPFSTKITIRFSKEFGQFASVNILDIQGAIKFKKSLVIDNETMELNELPIGPYILNIVSKETGKIETKKISKIN